MKKEQKKRYKKWRRHRHLRKKLVGTPERPRLSVCRSVNHIYCQIIDDTHIDEKGRRCGKTLAGCSTLTPDIRKACDHTGNKKAAALVGKEIARIAKDKGITKVSFDRGGNLYHGRVKALADAAREGGLDF